MPPRKGSRHRQVYDLPDPTGGRQAEGNRRRQKFPFRASERFARLMRAYAEDTGEEMSRTIENVVMTHLLEPWTVEKRGPVLDASAVERGVIERHVRAFQGLDGDSVGFVAYFTGFQEDEALALETVQAIAQALTGKIAPDRSGCERLIYLSHREKHGPDETSSD